MLPLASVVDSLVADSTPPLSVVRITRGSLDIEEVWGKTLFLHKLWLGCGYKGRDAVSGKPPAKFELATSVLIISIHLESYQVFELHRLARFG